MEIQIGETCGCHIGLEEECVADRRWKMINVLGGERHEIGGQEQERFFVFRLNEAEAVCVDGVKILEIFELLVGLGDDVFLFMVGWEFGDFREAAVDIDGAGSLGCRKENRPCFIRETANKEGFCFFGVVLEECWTETEVLLEREPVTNFRAEGCDWQVWQEAVKNNTE
jgi:hypothetical protein